MAAFGAPQGTSKSQSPTPDRDGKGHDSTSEAPKGELKKGIIPAGVKGTGNGFGA